MVIHARVHGIVSWYHRQVFNRPRSILPLKDRGDPARHLHSPSHLKVKESVSMDNIIRVTLGLLLVILIASAGVFSYQVFVDRAYRESLSSTYSYTCTITTDSPLANVTLFIPVPADPAGNSPVVAGFSARAITGIPGDWETTLFDTGKATLVKITTPAITPPPGNRPVKAFHHHTVGRPEIRDGDRHPGSGQ